MAIELGWTYAFYELAVGDDTAREIVWTREGTYNPAYDADPTNEEPDSRPDPASGEYDPAIYGWVAIPSLAPAQEPDEPLDTSTSPLQRVKRRVNVSTKVVTDTNENATIEERQIRVMRILHERGLNLRTLLSLYSNVRQEDFQDLRARLRRIVNVATELSDWGTNPESALGDANYQEPTLTLETTPLAERLAPILERRSIAPEKLVPYDSSNLTPLGNFDSGDINLYTWTNLPQPTFTTNTKSGGYAIQLGPRTASGSSAYLDIPFADYTPVEEGSTITFAASWRTDDLISNYTGAFQLVAVYLDVNYTQVGTDKVLFTGDAAAWQTKDMPDVVPTDAKYAGWRLKIPASAVAGAHVRVDAVSIRKVIASNQIATGATGNLVVNNAGSGTLSSTGTFPSGGQILASSGTDTNAFVCGPGTRRVAVIASVNIARNANGDTVRCRFAITVSKDGGAEATLADAGQWGFQEGGAKTFFLMAHMDNDEGKSCVFRLKGALEASHVGGNPTYDEAAICAMQAIR